MAKFPKIKTRKITRKGLVRKLDKLVSQIVIARDKKCVCCGNTNNLTGGHLFSRVAYSTRWDLMNVFCQCISCNLRHEYDPYPLTNYFISINGKKAYDNLHRRFVTPKKFKNFQLEEMVIELERIKNEK